MSMHTQIATKVNTLLHIETCISPLKSSLYYHWESNNCTTFQTTSKLFSKELITVSTDDIKLKLEQNYIHKMEMNEIANMAS